MIKRLQAIIASAGICSRRAAERLISDGRVELNGKIALLGQSADPICDVIKIDGQILSIDISCCTYILLNKPIRVISAVSDNYGRTTVSQLVSSCGKRLYPVGRLDYMSGGLLILTDDGALTYALTHPKHQVTKTYLVEVIGIVSDDIITKLASGLVIDGYKTSPAEVNLLNYSQNGATLEIKIHEGRNRQIRKMCALCGLTVKSLTRAAIGNIMLGSLSPGEWRFLTADEIQYLKSFTAQN